MLQGEHVPDLKNGLPPTQVGTLNTGLKESLVIESQVENLGKAHDLTLSTESLVADFLSHVLNYLTVTLRQQCATL